MTFMLVNYKKSRFQKEFVHATQITPTFIDFEKNTVYVLHFLRGWGRTEVGLNPNSAGELMKARGKVQFSCFWDSWGSTMGSTKKPMSGIESLVLGIMV